MARKYSYAFYITEELHAAIKKESDKTDLSQAEVIRQALEKAFKVKRAPK